MLEAVPNVSEGRDERRIDAVGEAFGRGPLLLDVHVDADHHRSVFTLAGEPPQLVDGLVTGVARAVELIDLREHSGVHPRVGVADVVPVVPLADGEMPLAVETAASVARRIGSELGVPVFLYAESGGGRRPAFFRSGGLAELVRRIEGGELVPDAGPVRVDPRSGVALVGARPFLVAYNLELVAGDVAVARAVARAVRASSGGMPGVQAIGLDLPGSGRVQVSLNVIDVEEAPLHLVVERVRAEARAHGADVGAGELVGLVPERVVREAEAAGVELPGVDESRILERVLGSRLAP